MEFTFDQYKTEEKKEPPNNRLTNDIPTRPTEKPQQPENPSTKSVRTDDLRNRINQSQSAKPLQTDDLRNRINEKREKQSTAVIDLTVEDSDGSKSSRSEVRQNNVQSDKKPPATIPKHTNSYPSHQPAEPQQAPVHPPLTKNNPFYFDVSKPPTSTIQFNSMQDRLKQQPKVEVATSNPIQSGTSNIERKSVMDRLQLARQVPPVPNVSFIVVVARRVVGD